MESRARKTNTALIHHYDFIQLLQKLEESNQLKNMQLIPCENVSFPATDIIDIKNNKIILSFMGLYGVDSPLPHYFYTYANDRLREFLTIFNHRLYQLFYISLKKYETVINHTPYLNYLTALSGGQLTKEDTTLFSSAGLLGRRIKSRVGLKALIKHYVGNIRVDIMAFIPQWVKIVPEKIIRLGDNSMLGEKVVDLNAKIRIDIGPLSLKRFRRYVNDKGLFNLLLRYCTVKIELCFLIKDTFNASGYGCLGLTSWLGTPQPTAVIRYPIIVD